MQRSPIKFAARFFPFDSLRERKLLSGTPMRRMFRAPQFSPQDTRRVLLAAILCALFAAPACAMPRRDSKAIHKKIEALEMQWRDAIVHNNVRLMDHLLADDYLGISANGTVETKAEELAQSKAGTLRIQSLNLSDIKVRVFGNTAVVTSKAELMGMNGQSDISGNYRYTRVYNKRFGQWKIISFEASRIHDVDARGGR
ncbi:MAG: nuclear transport factor 2 family protein [Acidobacteriaceae bacterium]